MDRFNYLLLFFSGSYPHINGSWNPFVRIEAQQWYGKRMDEI